MTGNTRVLAEAVQTALVESGHQVEYIALVPEGSYKPGQPSPPITTKTTFWDYDGLVFGSHVEAFSLSNGWEVTTPCGRPEKYYRP